MGKRNLLLVIIIFILLVGLYFILQTPKEKYPTKLKVGNNTIFLEVADSSVEHAKGLSGRTNLSSSSGLLFVFDHPGYHGIWMKDMHFPIDIIWLNESFNLIDIKENVSPETYPEVFTPKLPAKYVLEMNSGETTRHNLKIGMKTSLKDLVN